MKAKILEFVLYIIKEINPNILKKEYYTRKKKIGYGMIFILFMTIFIVCCIYVGFLPSLVIWSGVLITYLIIFVGVHLTMD